MLFVSPRIPYSQERFYTCSYLPYEPHTPLDNEDAFSRTSIPPLIPISLMYGRYTSEKRT